MTQNTRTKSTAFPKLVLLDRDGVINHDSENYIKNAAEWRPIKGSISAISKLQLHGIDVAVCTNQSGLGRGLIKMSSLLAIHERCNQKVIAAGGQPIRFFFCPHIPSDNCECRKPGVGLLRTAMSVFGVTDKETIFLGDSISDWRAGEAALIDFALVSTGNGSKTYQDHLSAKPNAIQYHADLAQYVNSLKL